MIEGSQPAANVKTSDLILTAGAENSSGQHLERADLLDALKTEIASQENKLRRPGWSTWALLGALTAVAWYGLHELETAKSNLHYLLAVFLIFSILTELWSSFRLALEPQSDRPQGQLRFVPWHFMGSQRILMLAHLFRWACLAAAAWNFLPVFSALGWYLLIYLGINLLLAFLGFISSFGDVLCPLPTGQRARLSSLILILPGLGGAVWLLMFLSHQPVCDFAAIRLGLATGGGLLLIVMLCDGLSPLPILQMLQDIQRDLSFGKITVQQAAQQTDIALAGMRLSDVLQRELQPLVNAFERLNLSRQEAANRLNLVRKIREEQGGLESLDAEQSQWIKVALEAADIQLKQNRDASCEINRLVQAMQKKLLPAAFIEPQVKPEIQSIIDRIKRLQAECQRDYDLMAEESKTSMKAVAFKSGALPLK